MSFLQWSVLSVVAAMMLPVAAVYAGGGNSMLDKAPPADQEMFAKVKILLLKEAARPMPVLAETDESYFWIVASRLTPLMRAYQYSKDPEFIEAFVPKMKQVLSQRYVHPTQPEVWSGWYHYRENDGMFYMPIHAGIMYYTPALIFVGEVRADPKLQEKYGDLAKQWFADITEVSIPAWDKRGTWHDINNDEGYYTHTTHYPDKDTGEIVARTDDYAGTTLAINKVHAMIEPLCVLYRMTGDEKYRQRIEKCENFARNRWRIDSEHVEWNYRDHAVAGDFYSGVYGQGRVKQGAFIHPKGGYYAADINAIADCYDLGIVFTQEDIELLIKTNLEFMWNGDKSNMIFRKIDGSYKADGPHGKGHLWTALARYNERTRELWKLQLDGSKDSWGWDRNALSYLIKIAEPVSLKPKYVKHAGQRLLKVDIADH